MSVISSSVNSGWCTCHQCGVLHAVGSIPHSNFHYTVSSGRQTCSTKARGAQIMMGTAVELLLGQGEVLHARSSSQLECTVLSVAMHQQALVQDPERMGHAK